MTFSAAERETPYLSGVYKAGELFININNGLGFTLAPVRYNAPPNISVIELQTK
jgi:predicted MPP superfamily phosphohydrolase